ncbi:Outer membrane usher protein fimD-related subfamily protein [Serratia symbiotica]|nr:Outer membrane usher protein fimD-related subfamily protein [Serratia symbiotica]
MPKKIFWLLLCLLFNILFIFIIYSKYILANDYFDPWSLEMNNYKNKYIDISNFNNFKKKIPGIYITKIYINGIYIKNMLIKFILNKNTLIPLLKKNDYMNFGIKENANLNFMYLKKNDIINDINKIFKNITFNFNINEQKLYITIPKEYIYINIQNNTNPKEWDDGLNMLFLNYNYSGDNSWNIYNKKNNYNSYLNLRSGINLLSWHLRNYIIFTNNKNNTYKKNISTYLQHDIKYLKSQCLIGENYSSSNIFNSFPFRGIQIFSDESMQPENKQGFAPVIRGIAKSNAQIIIRQNNNIIWNAYVSPGPFIINNLYPTSSNGDLFITIHETDGSKYNFIQSFSAVPIMQREGHLKYSFMIGKYYLINKKSKHPNFIQLTGIYGFPFSTTLYGGTIISHNYIATNIGIGKDLKLLGATSLDITFSNTKFNYQKQKGTSIRFQYSKYIPVIGTTFSIAGYKYSNLNYYNFNEANNYINNIKKQNIKYYPNDLLNNKNNQRSKIQININQLLGKYGNIHLSTYQKQYWKKNEKEKNINFNYNNNINSINYSINYSYTKQTKNKNFDKMISLNVQIPLHNFISNSYLYLSNNINHNLNKSSLIGLSGTVLKNNNITYYLQKNYIKQKKIISNINALINYKTSIGEYQIGYNYLKNQNKIHFNATGGIIIHPYGITFSQAIGETIALIRAPQASHVKINNTNIYTNNKGYAIIPNINHYHKNKITIDTTNLPKNIDILNDTNIVTPTHGALVIANFSTYLGKKLFLTLKNNNIPFGASAYINHNSSIISGIVNDHKQVYLSGVPSKGIVKITWNKGNCKAMYHIKPSNKFLNTITTRCY